MNIVSSCPNISEERGITSNLVDQAEVAMKVTMMTKSI